MRSPDLHDFSGCADLHRVIRHVRLVRSADEQNMQFPGCVPFRISAYTVIQCGALCGDIFNAFRLYDHKVLKCKFKHRSVCHMCHKFLLDPLVVLVLYNR